MFGTEMVKRWEQGNYMFAIRPFAPFKAMDVLGMIQKALSPALLSAVENPDEMGEAILKLSNSLDGNTLQSLVRTLIDPDYIAYSPKDKQNFQRLDEDAVNAVFWGRVLDMFPLCIEIFKVNYMDFSRASSVPTGLRDVLGAIFQKSQESAENTLSA